MTLAFLALLGAPYIYEISSLRVNIIKWQVKFNPVAYGLNKDAASCDTVFGSKKTDEKCLKFKTSGTHSGEYCTVIVWVMISCSPVHI